MKISVVTISFNQAPFLEEAMKSVLQQDYHDIEYIVVDAGSTDNSQEIIKLHSNKLKKFIFEKDDGPGDGLNKGLALCTGDIFCYLNADDRFLPGSFQFVADFFTKNTLLDGLIGAAHIIDEHGRRNVRRKLSSNFNTQSIMDGTAIALQQSTFLRLASIKSNNVTFNVNNWTCWDGEFLIDLYLGGCRFATTQKTLGEFRIYSTSITGSQTNRDKYALDRNRIREKVERSQLPYRKSGQILRRFLFMINPVRRALELLNF